jgi:hypothetical protein
MDSEITPKSINAWAYMPVIASGTNQATATKITSRYNLVSTKYLHTGVTLPLDISGEIYIINEGPYNLHIYPEAGSYINNADENTGVILVAGMLAVYKVISKPLKTSMWSNIFNTTSTSAAVPAQSILNTNLNSTSVPAAVPMSEPPAAEKKILGTQKLSPEWSQRNWTDICKAIPPFTQVVRFQSGIHSGPIGATNNALDEYTILWDGTVMRCYYELDTKACALNSVLLFILDETKVSFPVMIKELQNIIPEKTSYLWKCLIRGLRDGDILLHADGTDIGLRYKYCQDHMFVATHECIEEIAKLHRNKFPDYFTVKGSNKIEDFDTTCYDKLAWRHLCCIVFNNATSMGAAI